MSEEKQPPPNFTTLTENLSQQQAKISALKELVRQSEHGKNTASAQEKVKNIAQRLSNLKSKATKSKLHRASSELSEDYSITHYEEEENETTNIPSSSSSSHLRSTRSETPGSEKITLLRKQMELNRMKMAERENKSKEIEQMVTQLKSKFETSQMSLERSVELGRSMGDLSNPNVPSMLLQSQHRSVSDVSRSSASQPIMNFEGERIRFLEKRIRDLETELSNKENITESDVVQDLERKILDLEENLREKESLIDARTKAVSLLTENLSKKKKDVVDSLEDTKQEMFKMQETFLEAELTYKREVDKLIRVIGEKSNEITNLNEKCEILEKSRYDLTIENSELKNKLEDVQDYSTKISELNKLNETLQKRISTLESQRYEFITEDEVKSAEQLSSSDDLAQKIKEYEEMLKQRDEEIEKLQESLQEKSIEVNVVNANMTVLQEKYNALGPKPLFAVEAQADEESQAEITKLKQQLDESNKSMIKTKLKMKQMQKQIDTLQKSSDGSQEIARLNEEIQNLTQRIAELEEEKGSYQLQLVGNDNQSDLETKLKVLETTCQNQNTAIQLLEEQKVEMVDDLTHAKQEQSRIGELESRISELESSNNDKEHKIHQLHEEKEALSTQMNQYLNENMELLDKLEKLSKGSSAESIEMVSSLTSQEKEEIEQYQKDIIHKDEEVPIEISQELNDSLRSLRMESSELMEKIELFTIERREVLEKLDALTIENQVLSGNLEHVKEEKAELEKQIEDFKNEKEELEKAIEKFKEEKNEMSKHMAELSDHRTKLQEEINKLVKEQLSSSPQGSPVKASDSVESDQLPSTSEVTSTFDREACEKLLKQLDSEIQNLNKNKDNKQKLKISKKLSDNAKNVHAMMTNLLIEFYKNLDECKHLRDDLDKFKILLNNVSGDRTNEEIQNLQRDLNETNEKLITKTQECQAFEDKLISNESSINLELEQLKSELENAIEQSDRKAVLIITLQDTIDKLSNERDACEIEVQKQMTLVSDLRKEFDQLCADVKVNNQRLNEKSSELDQLQHEFDMRLKTSTSEVEILKTLVAEQKQLLIDAYQEHELDINQKIKEINDYQNQVKQMEDELQALKKQNASNQEAYANDLKDEIKKLNGLLSESNHEIETQKEALLHKQETIDTLNTQIIELYKSMEENANKVIEKDDELQYLQEIADSNRDEIRKAHEKLTTADKTIDDLRSQLTSKKHEIELLQQKTAVPAHDNKADERIKQLEAEIHSLDAKHKEQHDKLKKYAANLKKKQAQCTELEEKLAKSADVTDAAEMNELKAKVIQYEEQINLIKVENNKLNESIQKSSIQDEIDDLKWKLDEYEAMVADKSKEIVNLQNQLQQLSDKCDQMEEGSYELQSQIQKLESENSKLKEIEHELKSVKEERDRLSVKSPDGDKSDEKKKMDKLKAAVVQLKHKLADKKKEVEDLTAEIVTLKQSSSSNETSNFQQVEDLKKQIQELDEMNEKILSDTKVAYDNDIGLLRQKIDDLEASNRLLNEEKQRKVSLEGQLETFEMTNAELREKVARLEEVAASLDTEKNSLIREKLSLDKELEEKVNELACSEENYVQHLNHLIEQDQLIGRKLRETEADNFQLNETIKELNEERNSLLQKLSALEVNANAEAARNGQLISNYENDNSQLQQQIQNLQAEIKKLQTAHEQIIAAKHAEIDEMESQFSSQLQKIEAEKKTVQEALEKANDQIIDFQDEVVRLKDNTHSLEQARADLEREMSWLRLQNDNYTQDQLENEQLRMQLMQSETEFENLRSQNETMISNHEAEVLILRQQITDLEAMRSQVSQNQTDDQVMLQNENIKLKELLSQKENEIQQKVMQLQMATVFEAPVQVVNDPFSNLASSAPQPTQSVDINFEEKLKQMNDEMEKLREAQMMANVEMDMQSGRIHELMNDNKKLQEKTFEMQSIMDNLIRTNVDLESVNQRQKSEIETKEKEINEIQCEMNALRDHYSQSAQSTDDDKLNVLQSELVEKNRAIENLQVILKKYESQSPSTQPPVSSPQSAFSTSIFFNDPQPSTSSLFDDPFGSINVPSQPIIEDVVVARRAYVYDEQLKSSNETQTDEQWLIQQQDNINRILYLQNQLQTMEAKIMEQYMELESQRQRICELEVNQKPVREELPLVEPECVAKKAYLCYEKSQSVETQTNFDWLNEYVEKIAQLQNQIRILEEQQELKPIVEPQQQQQQAVNVASFFDNVPQQQIEGLEIEDTWGWDAAQLQQQQPLQASLLSPRSDLEVRLQEQKDIVEKLEKDKNVLNDELQNLRENSKKMMKKLKEYQQKIKELEANVRRSSSIESNDMDLVIQEELNSQVQKLEAKLKEINGEREKEQQEKDGLLKKIEVLSNTNDRMMEMKERQDSQMELYQLKIKDLSQKLHNLEEWDNETNKKEQQQQVQVPSSNNDELNKKIQDLNDQIKDMQVDYDELQALLDEEKNNNKLLEEKIQKINSEQSFNDASKDDEIERLQQQLKFNHSQVEAFNHQIDSLNQEIQSLNAKIDHLSQEVHQKSNENHQLNERILNLESSKDELSYDKQQSIERQIHDYEIQIQQLQGEMDYKNAQVSLMNEKNEELTHELQNIKIFNENLTAKEQEIVQLKAKLSESIQHVDIPIDDIHQKVIQLEKINSELSHEKSQMEHELQVLNDQVLASLEFEDRMKNTVFELDAKNMEIQMLKATLDKFQDNNQQVSSNDEIERLRHEKEELEITMKSSIDLLNAQWSQMVEQRGNEVANSWKQHLEMRETEFAELEASLKSQIESKTPAEGESKNENNDTLIKMKSIMESQEVEIVSLKEQLAIRSAEYAALSARVDPYHQMTSPMSVSPVSQSDVDKVPRSELDLALYMLHQRDMRLEEITMELVRLLEERDTLQLRLSNSIRQIEDIRKKFNIEGAESSDQSTPEKLPHASVEDDQLKAKLSELNTIRHSRDKGIADEREKRFMEQFSFFQRDVANIPEEAANRIVAGSDNQQSPSSVLMNWILGNKPESS